MPAVIASQGIPYLFGYFPDDRTSCSIKGYAINIVATAPWKSFMGLYLAQVEWLLERGALS